MYVVYNMSKFIFPHQPLSKNNRLEKSFFTHCRSTLLISHYYMSEFLLMSTVGTVSQYC